MPADRKKFLNRIAQIESSGGKDLEHPEMESGIHAGDAAVGRYGLMPNTVDEVLRRSARDNEMTETLQRLNALPKEERNAFLLANPDVEQEVAERLANRVLARQGDNEDKAAFAWNQGSNLPAAEVDKRGYASHPYVQKFRSLKAILAGGNK